MAIDWDTPIAFSYNKKAWWFMSNKFFTREILKSEGLKYVLSKYIVDNYNNPDQAKITKEMFMNMENKCKMLLEQSEQTKTVEGTKV
jgi:hypothetical protein